MERKELIKKMLDGHVECVEMHNSHRERKRVTSDEPFETQDYYNAYTPKYDAPDYQPHKFKLDVEFTCGRKFSSTIALREWIKGNPRLRTKGILEIRVAREERADYEQHPSDRQEIDQRVDL